MAKWTEEEFWNQVANDPENSTLTTIIQRFIEETRKRGLFVWGAKGPDAKLASFRAIVKVHGETHRFFQCWAQEGKGGKGVEIQYQFMKGPFALNGGKLATKVRYRFERIGLVGTSKKKMRPNFPFYTFVAVGMIEQFFEIIDWMLYEIRASDSPGTPQVEVEVGVERVPDAYNTRISGYLAGTVDDSRIEEEYVLGPVEDIDAVPRYVKNRPGQGTFRKKLLKRFGSRCAITGTAVEEVLEAAHIVNYRSRIDDNPQNGLLLRSDIHALFDNYLIGIEPIEKRVHLHPLLHNTEYSKYDGKVVEFSYPVSLAALEERWQSFQSNLARQYTEG